MPRSILGKLLLDLADSAPYRQSTRIPVAIPIKISGKDKGGHPFEEGTQTIDVGKQGVRTSTLHRLITNAKVGISDAAVERVRPARVVWQARTDSLEGRAEIGVEFLESLKPKSMWALESVPDDWLKGQLDLTTSQKLEYFWARKKTLPVSPEDLVDSTESLSVQAPGDFASVEHGIETVDSSAQASLLKAIKGNKEENDDVGIGADPTLPRTAGNTGWVASTPPQDPALTANDFPRIPREPTNPAPRSHADQARKDFPVEDLNRLAEILIQQADVISKGVDEALGSVQSAAEDAVAKLHDIQQQIESHLKKVSGEYEKRLAVLGDSSAEECRLKAEASLSNLRDELQQMEAQIRKITSEHSRQNAAEGASNENDNRQEVEASLADFRRQLEQTLNEFREIAADEVQDQLRRAAASLRGISAREQKGLQEKSAALQRGKDEYMSTRPGFMHRESDAAPSQRGLIGVVWVLALLMAVTAVLCGFAYVSTQPTRRLQAEPPAEFIDTNVRENLRPVEEQLARAYWKCAVQVIQKTYQFGRVLPEQPLAGFAIQPQDVVGINSKNYLQASRARYWQRLRRVWDNPQIWVQTYEWNTDWILAPLKNIGLMLRG